MDDKVEVELPVDGRPMVHRVLDALGTVLGSAEDITWADQQRGFSWLDLARG